MASAGNYQTRRFQGVIPVKTVIPTICAFLEGNEMVFFKWTEKEAYIETKMKKKLYHTSKGSAIL